VDATLTGAQTFGDGVAGPTVFQQIDSLVTALENNDQAGILTAIGDLDDAIGAIGVAQARVGGQLANLDQAVVSSETLKFQLVVQRGEKQDPDIATQATYYATAEQALVGSIELSKKLLSNSLLQWLR
jgi:flagellin-like hook-associated protein FlgL